MKRSRGFIGTQMAGVSLELYSGPPWGSQPGSGQEAVDSGSLGCSWLAAAEIVSIIKMLGREGTLGGHLVQLTALRQKK